MSWIDNLNNIWIKQSEAIHSSAPNYQPSRDPDHGAVKLNARRCAVVALEKRHRFPCDLARLLHGKGLLKVLRSPTEFAEPFLPLRKGPVCRPGGVAQWGT